MAFTLVIKAGSTCWGMMDGMPVQVLPGDEPLSDHMKKVFVILRLKDEDLTVIDAAMEPVVELGKQTLSRCKYIDLDLLAESLGDPTLVERWHGDDVVEVQDCTDLDISDFMFDSQGHEFPEGDHNAVSSGTFTVGSGGSYATFLLARIDIAASLTGDLTFNQSSDVSEVTNTSTTTVDLAGHKLTFQNNSPHHGDPTQGFKVTYGSAVNSVSPLDIKVNGTAGSGLIEIKDLRFVPAASVAVGNNSLVYVTTGGPNVKVHDLLFDATTSPHVQPVRISTSTGCTGSTVVQCWNVGATAHTSTSAYVTATMYVGMGAYNPTATVENVTIIGGYRGIFSGTPVVTIRNCQVLGSGLSCFVGITTNIGRNNYSSDATAADANWSSGTGNQTGVTAVSQFVSTSFSSVDFLKILPAASGANGGVAVTIPDNTVGIRGNPRPHGVSYSVGADEANAAPTVTLCTPNHGPATLTTPVSIDGTGFIAGATVTFGGTPATAVNVASGILITCTAPAHAAGQVDVVVTNPDTQSGTKSNGFTYDPAPTVNEVTPDHGTIAGGTSVIVNGTNFIAGAGVTFDGLPATGVSLINPTELHCVTPAHAAGAVDVVVTNPDAQSGSHVAGYLYETPSFRLSSGGNGGIPTSVGLAAMAGYR